MINEQFETEPIIKLNDNEDEDVTESTINDLGIEINDQNNKSLKESDEPVIKLLDENNEERIEDIFNIVDIESDVKKEVSKEINKKSEMPLTFMSSDVKDSDSDEENISLNLI